MTTKKSEKRKKKKKKVDFHHFLRVISNEETAAFEPSSLGTSSVDATIDATFTVGRNLFLTISETSTAREMALPRAFTTTSSDLLLLNWVMTART